MGGRFIIQKLGQRQYKEIIEDKEVLTYWDTVEVSMTKLDIKTRESLYCFLFQETY